MLTKTLSVLIYQIMLFYTWLRGGMTVRSSYTDKDFRHRHVSGSTEWTFICRQRKYDIVTTRTFWKKSLRSYVVEVIKADKGQVVGALVLYFPEFCPGIFRSTTLPHRLAIRQAINELTVKPP